MRGCCRAGKFFGDKKRPWTHDGAKFDIALPCATQNEVSKSDAEVSPRRMQRQIRGLRILTV